MKKITFKVSTPKENSLVSLIKEVNQISCRIHIDLQNGFVTVENVNDTMIDNVIELVDNYYTIIGVDIDNTFEENPGEQEVSVVTEITAGTVEEVVEETVNETVEVVTEKQPTVLEPQSEEDVIVNKIKFENEYVENLINKLLQTAGWAMFKMHIPEKEMGSFIYSTINEISMYCSYRESADFGVGDVVECNYGKHLNGEINGTHVAAIVCHVSYNGMPYLVPITKVMNDLTARSYLSINVPQDVIYKDTSYTGGIAILDKAKYVHSRRINRVVGKTTPEFFAKVLHQLANTFDFSNSISKKVEVEEDLPFTFNDDFYEKTDSETENSEATVASEPTDVSVDSKTSTNKLGSEEAALLDVIGISLDMLDKTIPVSEQVESFMTEINMQPAKLVVQSFVVACDIKKINYESVILELHKLNPNIKAEIIKASLKEEFKNWLKNYPVLAERCPKISLMSLIKVFVKRVSKENNC